jgi:hypothetical protein
MKFSGFTNIFNNMDVGKMVIWCNVQGIIIASI